MAISKLPIFQKVHHRIRKFSMKGLQKNLYKGEYSKLIDNGLYIRAKNWWSHSPQWQVKNDQGHQKLRLERLTCDYATEFQKVAM